MSSFPRNVLCLIVLALSAAGQTNLPASAGKPQSEAVGEVFASDATVRGSMMLAGGGMQVISGSAVAAGSSAAVLELSRGGQVRICPHTQLSINATSGGMMLGMGTGAVEVHYRLGTSADTILTPDFRVLLAGPADFHLAVASDAQGNTCIEALEGNSAAVILSELMGSRIYQVKAQEQVRFRSGRLEQPEESVEACGCPAPPQPQAVAAASKLPPSPGEAVSGSEEPKGEAIFTAEQLEEINQKAEQVAAAQPQAPELAGITRSLPRLEPEELHVEVDAPLVFEASAGAPPPPPPMVAQVKMSSLPRTPLEQPLVVLPPPEPSPQAKGEPPAKKQKGFFGKIASFFASIFR